VEAGGSRELFQRLAALSAPREFTVPKPELSAKTTRWVVSGSRLLVNGFQSRHMIGLIR
jgi:hypothetical protein